jgi:hypothetical protein
MRVAVRIVLLLWLFVMALAGQATWLHLVAGWPVNDCVGVSLIVMIIVVLWLFLDLLKKMWNP